MPEHLRHARGCNALGANIAYLVSVAADRIYLCTLLSDVCNAMGQAKPGMHPCVPRPTGSLESQPEAGAHKALVWLRSRMCAGSSPPCLTLLSSNCGGQGSASDCYLARALRRCVGLQG